MKGREGRREGRKRGGEVKEVRNEAMVGEVKEGRKKGM